MSAGYIHVREAHDREMEGLKAQLRVARQALYHVDDHIARRHRSP